MMQPDELLQFSWPCFNDTVSCLDEIAVYGSGIDADMESGFSLFNTIKDSPDLNSSHILQQRCLMSTCNDTEDMFGWLEEREKSYPSKQPLLKETTTGALAIHEHCSSGHAYGEAVEKGEAELAVVLMNRIQEKVSPAGEVVERLSYYLFQPTDKQTNYLRQESAKNFNVAFKAFYQIFPYGRFAHFAANSAVLEAMPHDAETIHIVDFDMEKGYNGLQ
ncbi:hypothetical protein CK203_053339 [Vitis vinifera]|uniref:Uncharacterized protein n=1 Tax=Vitis vinifera TaxID=29760 RepID=A0A438GWA7_VITVI|nr:hypothetical protein CK203_053339 [Vitis vinifera]